ncbi:MAG: metalloregulator ArsR/SmtB family transcription factor, partial [Gemmatimonadaceae bacterium]
MVNYQATLDRTFSALADPVRRAMLSHLTRGEATVSELGAPHRLTLPAVLKHVRYLESAGLLKARKE